MFIFESGVCFFNHTGIFLFSYSTDQSKVSFVAPSPVLKRSNCGGSKGKRPGLEVSRDAVLSSRVGLIFGGQINDT